MKGLGESHLVCALTSQIRRSFLTVFAIELLFARTSMRNTGMLRSSIFFFMACLVLATAQYWYLGLRSRWRVQGRWKVTDVQWKVTDVRDLHFMGAVRFKSARITLFVVTDFGLNQHTICPKVHCESTADSMFCAMPTSDTVALNEEYKVKYFYRTHASCLGTRWIRCRICGELTTRCVAVELGEGEFALRANSPSAKTSCRADNIWPES